MKKITLLKSMLLLCALVVGSGSVWADDITATLTGEAMFEGEGTQCTAYAYHTVGVTDDKGNVYTGNWCYYNSSGIKEMIQLKKYATSDCAYIALPRYKGNIISITITATDANSLSSTGSGAKTALRIVKGTEFNKTEADVPANKILEIGDGTNATKTYSFDFTSLPTKYDGKGLYICSINSAIRIWSIVVVTDETANPTAIETKVDSYTEVATITSTGACVCSPTSSAIVTTKSVKTTGLVDGYSYGFNLTGSTNKITITLPVGAINAKVKFLCATKTVPQVAISSSKYAISWEEDAVSGFNGTIGINGSCDIMKQATDLVVCKITLTYDIPSATKLYLTTTDNMDGWRSFYESTTQNYEVDANTTIYTVASKTGESNTVELTAASGKIIPGKTPVILKTTAGDHKIVLTKTETHANLGSNLLAAATGSSAIDGYRLGFGSIGVGFYKYAGTPAAGTVYIDSGNVTTSARELGIGFGDDVTAINKVEAKKVENRVFFNLAGQQVAQPTKGLYIVNGRKVVIK